MFKKLLFVCTGNVCRSPMAEGLFRQKLSEIDSDAIVSSAGLQALVKKPAVIEAQSVAREHNIDISKHRARQLTHQMVYDSELIFVMEKAQKKLLEDVFPHARGRVFLLGKWRDYEIPDPYCLPQSFFQSDWDLMEQSWQEWRQVI